MKAHRPILTPHRRRRLILWALTLLSWLAANLSGFRISRRHRAQRGDISLRWLTRLVASLLIIRAAELAKIPRQRARYWRFGRDRRPRHLTRSLLGAKLRRALKHRDFRTHIAQLINVLRNLDHYAAQFARTVRRRHRLFAARAAIGAPEAVFAVPAPAPALADSS